MSEANKTQVGGNHYRDVEGEQHWDRAIRLGWDVFQYQITKYVERWKKKGGIKDLQKAQHFLAKYIEAVQAGHYLPAFDDKLKPEDMATGKVLSVENDPRLTEHCCECGSVYPRTELVDWGFIYCVSCRMREGASARHHHRCTTKEVGGVKVRYCELCGAVEG